MYLNEITAQGPYAFPGHRENLVYSLQDMGINSVEQLMLDAQKRDRVPGHADLQVLTYADEKHVLITIVKSVRPSAADFDDLVAAFQLKNANHIAPNHYQVDTIGVIPEYRAMGLGKFLYDYVIEHNGWTLISGNMQTEAGRRAWFNIAKQPHIGVYGLIPIDKVARYNSPPEIVKYCDETHGANIHELNELLKKYDAGVYADNSRYIVFLAHPVIGKLHTPHFTVYDGHGDVLLVAKYVDHTG